MTQHEDIQYWTERLKENNLRIRPLVHKMYGEHCTLSTEDQHCLRGYLTTNSSIITLLNETVSKPDPVKSFWKRIIRK